MQLVTILKASLAQAAATIAFVEAMAGIIFLITPYWNRVHQVEGSCGTVCERMPGYAPRSCLRVHERHARYAELFRACP